ncbi:MAG: hypothetical protein J7L94_01050, partial [Caldisericaceae bacterium]|nr:hypothetical protein [Caldisericaceae bacterium]
IDENDIWAVGEIYTADDKYNAAHWDGEKWELMKIFIKGYFYPLKTIFSFVKTDIWVANLTIMHFNGKNIDYYTTPPLDENGHAHRINKIWGTSSSDLYVVGNNGLIAHYNGQEWQRIESGTDLPIQDILGAFNKETGKYEILCVASNEYNNYGKKIINIENKKATFIQDDGLPWSLRSIWFIPDRVYYVCGSGIFFNKSLHNHWKEVGKNIQFYSKYIKGFDFNDIFIVGAFGLVSHYNGIHWFQYLNKAWDAFNGAYYCLDYKRNLMVAVGEKLDQSINTKAVILIGRKK